MKRDSKTRHLWKPSLRLSGRCPIAPAGSQKQVLFPKPVEGNKRSSKKAFSVRTVVSVRKQSKQVLSHHKHNRCTKTRKEKKTKLRVWGSYQVYKNWKISHCGWKPRSRKEKKRQILRRRSLPFWGRRHPLVFLLKIELGFFSLCRKIPL
jgi:hypothetical protein